MKPFESLGLIYDGTLRALDQTRLPHEERWVTVVHPDEMVALIKTLSVRGAPLIGACAAASLALYAKTASREEILAAAARLRDARPTAVNLMWAIDTMVDGDLAPDILSRKADHIIDAEKKMSDRMADHGALLIDHREQILTHCNTGGLATVGIGTALGVIKRAHENGKDIHVWVDETRPLLQGARLTAWELKKAGIPHTLICDGNASFLMARGEIDRVLVGADRIATNGDFANKIGTYSAAIAAKYHEIPFHPVAPRSTVDLSCGSGDSIPIEQRPADEVRYAGGKGSCALLCTSDTPAHNDAFDVTPAHLVESLILDTGVYEPKVFQSIIQTGAASVAPAY